MRRFNPQVFAAPRSTLSLRPCPPGTRYTLHQSKFQYRSASTVTEQKQTVETKTVKHRPTESQQEASSQSDIDHVKQAQENATFIDTQSNEYSKSGSDDAVADLENVSFDRSAQPGPEDANEQVNRARNMKTNPLEVSPANRDVSKYSPEIDGGASEHASKTHSTKSRSSYHAESARKVKSVDQKKDFKGFDRRKKEDKDSPISFRPGNR